MKTAILDTSLSGPAKITWAGKTLLVDDVTITKLPPLDFSEDPPVPDFNCQCDITAVTKPIRPRAWRKFEFMFNMPGRFTRPQSRRQHLRRLRMHLLWRKYKPTV